MPRTTLRIAQPCTESWDAMTPAAAGRYCAACQKTVVDFSQKTDAEILAHFRQEGAGNTCGRFLPGQVGRGLRPARLLPEPMRWQAWLASLLVAALATQSCQPTSVGEIQPKVVALASATATDSVAVEPDSATVEIIQMRTVSGQVYDAASRRPVARATVQLKDTDLTATSDATGHFAIQLPETLPVPYPMVFRLSAPGYSLQLLAAAADQMPTRGLALAHLSYPLPEMLLGEVEALPAKSN